MKNKMKRKKYYIAYGNSLSVGQMMQRCPGAQIVGQAVLVGWELLFRGVRNHRTESEEKHTGSGVENFGEG